MFFQKIYLSLRSVKNSLICVLSSAEVNEMLIYVSTK